MKTAKSLPEAELEVMKALWHLEKPSGRAEIEGLLNQSKTWATQTILTMLSRLEKKGFVAVVRAGEGRGNLYSASVQKNDYLQSESKTVLDKLFGGSPKAFMASLLQSDRLSTNDIEELESYIRATALL